MRKVLMTAFHFPPQFGSSGVQRTLRFVQDLPDSGWQPLVVTAHERAYPCINDELRAEVPTDLVLRRAFALDASRHLAVAGRYFLRTALPDRWSSWQIDGVRQGLALVRAHQAEVVWSTFPIASAHVIAGRVAQRAGLPWVADFRDPMLAPGYTMHPATQRSWQAIEAHTVAQAAACVFTTSGSRRLYAERYPAFAHKLHVIENGYDERSFTGLVPTRRPAGAPFVLLHSGLMYPRERNPAGLFRAVRQMVDQDGLTPKQLQLRFRAAVHSAEISAAATEAGVAAFVDLQPAIPYRSALQEMLDADALLLIQGQQFNGQVPAKIYEYLRAARPIMGLIHPDGAAADALRSCDRYKCSADVDDTPGIASVLRQLLHDERHGALRPLHPSDAAPFSRAQRATELAQLLATVAQR
jgi:hypothetical protein